MDILNKLPTNAMIQAALANKKLDNADSLPEMKKLLEKYSQTRGDLNFLKAIHVAGSKGKGSVCAFTESILRSKGFKTGMFTSPHLVHPRERIRINGKAVSKEVFAEHVLRLDAEVKRNQDQVSFFRFIWILAIDIFREANIDVGIIEVGMGGRFDATNVIEQPRVCGITSLAMEHVNLLGPTIRDIAWNKAGIIKSCVPVLSVKQSVHPETEEIIQREAEENGSPVQFIDSNSFVDDSWILGISGEHQKENAALACALSAKWMEGCNVSSPISKAEFKAALHSAHWPGRQQIHRVSDDWNLFLDGSHTFESVSATADWFSQHANANDYNILFFHCSPDRDHVKLLQPLLNVSYLFRKVYFMLPSSVNGEVSKIVQHHHEMADYWNSRCLSDSPASVISDIPDNFVSSKTNALVCGSLYLVGHFMNTFKIET